MIDPGLIAAMRRFNRFYTQKIGVLGEGLADTQLSLTQARLLYELAHRDHSTAAELSAFLALDPGYVSRILQGFERKKMLTRTSAARDRRQTLLALTAGGKKAFGALDRRTIRDLQQMLKPVSEADRHRLASAMATIEAVLGGTPANHAPFLLRPPRAGDFGWVVAAHGRLYSEEYHWDETFEGMVAELIAKFLATFDPKHDRGWIAERDGENIGGAFVMKVTSTVAQLRMLIVAPKARGLGLGRRLVDECIRFARDAGYRKLTLFTVSQLISARRIYQAAGFQLVHESPEHTWGHDVVHQTWDLDLSARR